MEIQTELIKQLKDKLDNVFEGNLKIYVTGSSGVGKSSLVNRLRGLTDLSPGAAKVGITQTTMEVGSYPHPLNANFILYDLPGVGTTKFPKETYFEKYRLNEAHFVILVTRNRFSSNDHLIYKYCQTQDIPFCLVRTHMDIDIKGDKERGISEAQAIQSLRNECFLEEFPDLRKDLFFLISCREKHFNKWDSDNLQTYISNSLHGEVKDVFILRATTTSEVWLEKKSAILRRFIPYVAGASAASSATAMIIPGVDFLCDLAVLLWFTNQIFDIYGLGWYKLAFNNIPISPLVTHFREYLTKEGIIKLLKQYAGESTVETMTRYVPIVGPLIASSISFLTTYKMCDFFVELGEKAARESLMGVLDIKK